MAASETIRLDVILQSEQFRSEVKKIASGVKKVENQTKKTAQASEGFLKQIRAGWLAVSAAVLGVARALGKAVKAASEFEEANDKFKVVFKGVRKEANAMRKELVNSYIMSTKEATLFLSSVQDMLVPMGIARGDAAKMSGEFVKLSADLASFNKGSGATAETVMQGIQSALAGQIEPMRRYGVFLTQNRIKQEAVNLGYAKAGEELTQMAKAQATLSIITKDSNDAMGNVKDTADSYANTMAQLKAIADDVVVIIGQELIGSLKPIAVEFRNLAKSADGIDDLKDSIQRVVAGVKAVLNAMTLTAGFFIGIGRVLIAPIEALIRTLMQAGDIIDLVMNRKWGEARDVVKEQVANMRKDIADSFDGMGVAFENIWDNAVIVMRGKQDEINDIVDEGVVIANDAEVVKTTFAEQQAEVRKLLASEEWKAFSSFAGQAIGEVNKLQQAQAKAEETRIKRRKDRQIAALRAQRDAGIINEQEFQDSKTAFERDAAKEIAKTRRKAWRAQKAANVTTALINAAQAILNALANVPYPLNLLAAATVGGLTGVQIATIQAQEPPAVPAFARGGIAGKGGTEFIRVGERGPEAVLPANLTRMLTAAAGAGDTTNTMTLSEGSIVVNVSGGDPVATREAVYDAVRDLSDDLGRGNLFRG